jgi:hypothetical protein
MVQRVALGPCNACNTRMLHVAAETARHQRERVRGAPSESLRLLQRARASLQRCFELFRRARRLSNPSRVSESRESGPTTPASSTGPSF